MEGIEKSDQESDMVDIEEPDQNQDTQWNGMEVPCQLSPELIQEREDQLEESSTISPQQWYNSHSSWSYLAESFTVSPQQWYNSHSSWSHSKESLTVSAQQWYSQHLG